MKLNNGGSVSHLCIYHINTNFELIFIQPNIERKIEFQNSSREMAITLKYCMALLLVVTLLSVDPCFGSLPFEAWTVQVHNDMKRGRTLFLHCKSRDNDLGRHNLGVGKKFTWNFKVNLFSSTLFWCYMRDQRGRHVSLDVFNARDDGFLYGKCWEDYHNCIWSVRDDGIYIMNTWDEKFEFVAKWEA